MHTQRLRPRSLTSARSSSTKAAASVECARSQNAATTISRVMGVSRGGLSFGLASCRAVNQARGGTQTSTWRRCRNVNV